MCAPLLEVEIGSEKKSHTSQEVYGDTAVAMERGEGCARVTFPRAALVTACHVASRHQGSAVRLQSSLGEDRRCQTEIERV